MIGTRAPEDSEAEPYSVDWRVIVLPHWSRKVPLSIGGSISGVSAIVTGRYEAGSTELLSAGRLTVWLDRCGDA